MSPPDWVFPLAFIMGMVLAGVIALVEVARNKERERFNGDLAHLMTKFNAYVRRYGEENVKIVGGIPNGPKHDQYQIQVCFGGTWTRIY